MPNASIEYVLPPEVLLIPVDELHASVRRKIRASPNAVAVTKPEGRSATQIVDADAATLLAFFRSPSTITDAVIAYCANAHEDPLRVLDQAYPLITRLRRARLLVPLTERMPSVSPLLSAGTQWHELHILRAVRILDDVQVYQAQSASGQAVALKVTAASEDNPALAALTHEAEMLRQLGGTTTPRLLEQGESEGLAYLVSDWISGRNCAAAAAALRASDTRGRADVAALCQRIVAAYVRLHQEAIAHGDVQPENVLVGDDGAVVLVDFGGAVAWAREDVEPVGRVGVPFFYDPELAAAVVRGRSSPAATEASDQYAVAVLVDYLLVGELYLDLSLDKLTACRQIVRGRPRSFAERSSPVWPEVEAVLRRALAKRPDHRFPLMSAFAAALASAIGSENGFIETAGKSESRRTTTEQVTVPKSASAHAGQSRRFSEEVLRRFRPGADLYRRGLPTAPRCSLHYGAAGVAYVFHRLACLREEPELLTVADVWVQRAERESDRPDAFASPQLGFGPADVGAISLHHSLPGVKFVRGLVSASMGDASGASAAVAEFMTAASQPAGGLDLAFGQAGTLIGCAAMLEVLPHQASRHLRVFGAGILESIWAQLQDTDMSTRGRVEYFGIAHGWAGILFACLRFARVAGVPVPAAAQAALDALAGLARVEGRGATWPLIADSEQTWPGWCHGSAGYVHLWTLAHQQLGDVRYLDLAERAAWDAWRRTSMSVGLCCGLAGQSYALLRWAKASGEELWRRRAHDLASRATRSLGMRAGPFATSLYRGELGVALLVAEIGERDGATMPAFDAEP